MYVAIYRGKEIRVPDDAAIGPRYVIFKGREVIAVADYLTEDDIKLLPPESVICPLIAKIAP